MSRFYFRVFADYFGFELLDDGALLPPDRINQETIANRVATSQGVINVTTQRNYYVPVVIEILAAGLLEDHHPNETWDHVVECSIEITSGRLVVLGTTDYYPDAPRIPIQPGTYQATIYSGGLSTLSEDGLRGEDVYWIVLQPGPAVETRVIKRFSD